ncbi:MAG: cysteine hydrolase family protein [Burkholderiales bacterium]
MQVPVEIRDRSDYKRQMKELLAIDLGRTVVLTIDMQRDYLDSEVGSNLLPPQKAQSMLIHGKDLLDFARDHNLPVIHTYVRRRRVEIDHGLEASPFALAGRQRGYSQHARGDLRHIPDRLEGSPQAEVPAALVAPGDTHVTSKKTADGFYGTELELILGRVHGATHVALAGINTETCVYSTAFSLSNRGFKTIVISDCVGSTRGEDHHWMALELMSRTVAWVLSVTEFKKKVLDASPAAAAA